MISEVDLYSPEIMDGMLETLTSQIRNCNPLICVDQLLPSPAVPYLGVSLLHNAVRRKVVCIPLPHIQNCMNSNKIVTWRYESECPIEYFDAVILFFGAVWSAIPGATEPKSQGNKFKDDFRRLALTSSLRAGMDENGPLYYEVRTTLTERNIKALMYGFAVS